MEIKEYFKVIKIDAVAKRMGKSRVWLSKRINQTNDRGFVAKFKPDELELLRKTLNELAVEIITNAQKLTQTTS